MSINKFFEWLPDTILNFAYCLNENSEKEKRVKLLKQILLLGQLEFEKVIKENNSFKMLLEFERQKELDEWVISGLNKKQQDEIFYSDSEVEIVDSP